MKKVPVNNMVSKMKLPIDARIPTTLFTEEDFKFMRVGPPGTGRGLGDRGALSTGDIGRGLGAAGAIV